MKKIYSFVVAMLATVAAFAQGLSYPPSGDNQKSSVSQWIGPVEVNITYNSPDVHGPNGEDRTSHIWGELVHYGYKDQQYGTSKAAPWRAGANESTVIKFSHAVKIQGKDVPAGSYGLFFDVQETGPWTLILSKNTSSWGSYYYNPAEDALRVQVTPTEAPYTEFLTYGFDERLANSTTAYLAWEKKKVTFKIDVPNVNEIYVAKMGDELRSSLGFVPQNWSAAAQFAAMHRINLDQALLWADGAMDPNNGGVRDFNALGAKASVLMAMGKNAEANAVMDEAIKAPGATVQGVHQYGRQLLTAGQNEKALEVFKWNAKNHPEEKFTTFVGLARGYAAVGNKKEAIKNWEIALKNLPANQANNKAFYEGELKKLKES